MGLSSSGLLTRQLKRFQHYELPSAYGPLRSAEAHFAGEFFWNVARNSRLRLTHGISSTDFFLIEEDLAEFWSFRRGIHTREPLDIAWGGGVLFSPRGSLASRYYS